MRPLAFACALLLTLAGCGPLSPPTPRDADAGAAGGGEATGGGGGGGAPTGPFTFSAVSLPSVGTANSVIGVSGSGSSVYAMTNLGSVYRSTGGEFALLVSRLTTTAASLLVIGDTLFVGAGGTMRVCQGGCTQASDFSVTQVEPTSLTMGALCGDRADEVYAIGNDGNAPSAAYRWNGQTWQRVGTNLDLFDPRACVIHGGDVYVAGRATVLRFRPATSGWSTEPMDYAGLAPNEVENHIWHDIGGRGGAFFVAGSRKRIMRRDAGGWVWVQNPNDVGELSALAVVGDEEMYLFHVGSSNDERVLRFDGTSWSPLDVALPLSSPKAAWVQDAATFYVGGSTGGAPALFRATR